MAQDYRLGLLKNLSENERWLEPIPDIRSRFGYSYPDACECLHCPSGEELEDLAFLAQQHLLEQRFFDKIHLCPECGHFQLNFREICVECSSSDIRLSKQLHHFPCGYVAPEQEFQIGLDYQCPKCKQTLRHIGVDYDEPVETFVCNQCQAIFADADVSCVCLHCHERFAAEAAVKRTLYSYHITHKGVIAAQQGIIQESRGDHLLDPDFPVYTQELLLEFLKHHFNETKRYENPLQFIRVGFENLTEYGKRQGSIAKTELFRTIVLNIRQALRNTDIIGLLDESTLGLLLPETSAEAVAIVIDKVAGICRFLLPDVADGAPLIVHIAHSAYTPGLPNAEAILDTLQLKLSIRRDGGE